MLAGQVDPKKEGSTAKRQKTLRRISSGLLSPLPGYSGSVSSWQGKALRTSLKAEDEVAP